MEIIEDKNKTYKNKKYKKKIENPGIKTVMLGYRNNNSNKIENNC